MTTKHIHRALLSIALWFAGTSLASAAPVTLSLPTIEAKPGDVIELPISAKGAKGMSGLQMLLTFDPAVLEVVVSDDAEKTFSKGKILPERAIARVATEDMTPGRLPIVFVGGVDEAKKQMFAVEEDGVLLTVRFRVIGQSGQKAALAIEKAEAFQLNDMDMLVKTEAGEVAVIAVSNEFPWLWIAIGIGVLALLLLLVLMTRRKRPAQDYR